MREYTGPGEFVLQVMFVPGDPPRLAAATRAALFLWELTAPAEPTAVLKLKEPDEAPRLTAAADGSWFAVGSSETLEVLNWPPRAVPTSVKAPGFLDVCGVGRQLCWLGAWQGRLYVQRIDITRRGSVGKPSTPIVVALIRDKSFPLRTATLPRLIRLRSVTDLSPDGRRVAMSGFTTDVHQWDAQTGERLGDFSFPGFPCAVSFAPDASMIAVEAGTALYVCHADTREVLARWKWTSSHVPSLAWSPDGRLLARADHTTTVRLLDASTGRQVAAVGTKRGRCGCVAFAPDGLTFATGTWDGPVRVWDVDAG